jgi:asparagine synthase (glutamine-hydrolysing)
VNAIAGIFNRSGMPLDQRQALTLDTALKKFGPDGEEYLIDRDIAMVCRIFETDETDCEPKGPFRSANGFIIAVAGRADNLDEMLSQSQLSHGDFANGLLALYRLHGVCGLQRVVGEFVASIWDPIQQQLLLIGDPLGRQTLYYNISNTYCSWASRPRALLTHDASQADVSREYIADFLLNRASPHSPYRGIHKLGAGEVITISRISEKRAVYWRVSDVSGRTRIRSDTEYEEEFSELLAAAIACRSDTRGPVFCELSGGLDSTSIAYLADSCNRKRRDVWTVSYVFPGSHSADESQYVKVARQGLRGPHVVISDIECPPFAGEACNECSDFPTNDLVFLARHNRLVALMQDAGGRVVLNGIGGDQLFWSTPHIFAPIADAIAERRYNEVPSAIRHCSEITGVNYCHLLVTVISGIVHRRTLLWDHRDAVGGWFSPDFMREVNLLERAHTVDDDVGFALPSKSYQYSLIRHTMREFALTRFATQGHVEVRYPYLDQRLIEFALALPFNQAVRWPQTRSIVRRALRGIVPDAIIARTTKAGPTEAYLRRLIQHWPRFLSESSHLEVEEQGIVDPDRFRNAVDLARVGVIRHSAQLLSTLSLELWLRSVKANRPVHEGETGLPLHMGRQFDERRNANA